MYKCVGVKESIILILSGRGFVKHFVATSEKSRRETWDITVPNSVACFLKLHSTPKHFLPCLDYWNYIVDWFYKEVAMRVVKQVQI